MEKLKYSHFPASNPSKARGRDRGGEEEKVWQNGQLVRQKRRREAEKRQGNVGNCECVHPLGGEEGRVLARRWGSHIERNLGKNEGTQSRPSGISWRIQNCLNRERKTAAQEKKREKGKWEKPAKQMKFAQSWKIKVKRRKKKRGECKQSLLVGGEGRYRDGPRNEGAGPIP